MEFLNPWMLLALGAAAIPLLIHLFYFRRPRRQPFSSLRFLKTLEASAIRRFRLRQWWLLLVRTLLIVSLVLAFSRPVARGSLSQWLGTSSRAAVALVVDNSLSMTIADERGPYWRQAREMAEAFLGTLRKGDWIYLIPTSGIRSAKPEAITSPEAARAQLEALGPDPVAHPLEEILRQAAEVLQEAPVGERAIVIFSDFQRTLFRGDSVIRLPGTGRLHAIPIGTRVQDNIGIRAVEVASALLVPGQPARLRITVANYGRAPVVEALISVHIEGQRLAQGTFSLSPEEETTVELSFLPPRAGWLSGVVQLEDDPFPHDNQFLFSLYIPQRFRLLLVQGEDANTNWLELALSPEVLGTAGLAWTRISPRELDGLDLSGFDAVWIVGVQQLAEAAFTNLIRFVENGGGLCLFPAEGSSALYGRLTAALGGGVWGTVRRFERPVPFGTVEISHPLLEGLFVQNPLRPAQPESPEIFRVLPYQPGAGGRDQLIIVLATGEAFLTELRPPSGGRVLLYGLSPEPEWSDWPFRGLFAPLLYRSLLYTASADWNRPAAFPLGEPVWIPLPGSITEPVRLTGPDGVPQMLEPAFGAGRYGLRYTAMQAGQYEVRSGETFLRYVAFNSSPDEGDVRRLSAGEVEQRLRASGWTVQVHGFQDLPTAERLRTLLYGIELWPYFLFVALLLLLLEAYLSRSWVSSRQATATEAT